MTANEKIKYLVSLSLSDDTSLHQVLDTLEHLRDRSGNSSGAAKLHIEITIEGSELQRLRDEPGFNKTPNYPQPGSVDRNLISIETINRAIQILTEHYQAQHRSVWHGRDIRNIPMPAHGHICRMIHAEWVTAKTAYPTRPDVDLPKRAREDIDEYLRSWGLAPTGILARA